MKYIIIKFFKYLSLCLVLSFFLIHKIFPVIIGIFVALYELNNKNMYNLLETNNNNKEEMITEQQKNDEINNIKLSGESNNLRLALKIEELGFIPSMNNSDDKNAA